MEKQKYLYHKEFDGYSKGVNAGRGYKRIVSYNDNEYLNLLKIGKISYIFQTTESFIVEEINDKTNTFGSINVKTNRCEVTPELDQIPLNDSELIFKVGYYYKWYIEFLKYVNAVMYDYKDEYYYFEEMFDEEEFENYYVFNNKKTTTIEATIEQIEEMLEVDLPNSKRIHKDEIVKFTLSIADVYRPSNISRQKYKFKLSNNDNTIVVYHTISK